MKIEITLKSGMQFVTETEFENLNDMWQTLLNGKAKDNDTVYGERCSNLTVVVSEIAAIRRIEEPTQTFEPVDNDPEKVYERELEKEKERWER